MNKRLIITYLSAWAANAFAPAGTHILCIALKITKVSYLLRLTSALILFPGY